MKKIPLIILAGMTCFYALIGYASNNKQNNDMHISFYDKEGKPKTLSVICMERDTYDNDYGRLTSCSRILVDQSFVGLKVKDDNNYGNYYASIKIAGKWSSPGEQPVLMGCHVPDKLTNPTLLKVITKRKDSSESPDVDCCYLMEKDVTNDRFTNCK